MASFEKIRHHWIWGVLAFILTVSIAGSALLLQCKSSRHELGGFLNATFHNRNLNNKDSRTIVVCLEDTNSYSQNIYITPTFDNPDEFSLRDFSLEFEATCENVEFIPSSFVKLHRTGGNTFYYKYDQDVLQAHMDTKNPFVGFKIKKDNARCEVVSRVSFDGASNLFEYMTDIWFVYVPNKKNLPFDVWKLNCKQRVFSLIDDKQFDIYYIANNRNPEYQFDVVLTPSDKNERSINNKSEDKNETAEKPTSNNIVTISPYKTEDAIANADLDIYDYELVPGDSTQLTIYLNQSVSATGTYILKFDVKDGWWLKSKYCTLFLKKGESGCNVHLYGNYNKIANLQLYHRVNPNSFLDIKKNYKGNLLFTIEGNFVIGTNYGDGVYYITEVKNAYSKKFDKPVSIELFDDNHAWWEKINEDEEGAVNYTILFIFIGVLLIGFLSWIINDNALTWYVLITLGAISVIILGGTFIIEFYYILKFLINYIYLMI